MDIFGKPCVTVLLCAGGVRVLFAISVPHTFGHKKSFYLVCSIVTEYGNNIILDSMRPVRSSQSPSLGICVFIILNAIENPLWIKQNKNVCLQTGNYTASECLHAHDISMSILTFTLRENKMNLCVNC